GGCYSFFLLKTDHTKVLKKKSQQLYLKHKIRIFAQSSYVLLF
ncbi:unnamed protein product, partial [Larinioides sclopetarius]